MGHLLDRLRKKHAGDHAAAKRHGISFLAHKAEIAEALREGWTAKQIWELMREDGVTTMSYVHFCRLVKKHIAASVNSTPAGPPSPAAPSQPSSPLERPRPETSANKSNPANSEITEKERLDLLKEEAFRKVRSFRPAGPLIGKPKSREEENRELFGE